MVTQNAMYLNVNVAPETLVISLRSPFPADSFRQVQYLPHTGTKPGKTMNLKGMRPIAWRDKLLPAASAVLFLKAIDLKCWSEISFLVFRGLQSFRLVQLRQLQL